MLVSVKIGCFVTLLNTRQWKILKSLENLKREILYLDIAYLLNAPVKKNAE